MATDRSGALADPCPVPKGPTMGTRALELDHRNGRWPALMYHILYHVDGQVHVHHLPKECWRQDALWQEGKLEGTDDT